MRVTISDGLAEELETQLNGRGTLEGEVEKRLTETLHASGSRVVLSVTELDQIASRISTGLPLRTKADLFRAINQTAQLTLGNERLVWTPSQLAQIEERARKIGETPERFVARVAAKLLLDVFMVAPGDQGVFYTPGFDPTDDFDQVDAALDGTNEEPG